MLEDWNGCPINVDQKYWHLQANEKRLVDAVKKGEVNDGRKGMGVLSLLKNKVDVNCVDGIVSFLNLSPASAQCDISRGPVAKH